MPTSLRPRARKPRGEPPTFPLDPFPYGSARCDGSVVIGRAGGFRARMGEAPRLRRSGRSERPGYHVIWDRTSRVKMKVSLN